MIILSFDVGRKKTGIAIGNLLTMQARPLTTVRGGRSSQLATISKLIGEWKPHKLLVGLPQHMDGTAHAMTRFCRDFSIILQQFNLPIEFVDERQSTLAARTAANRQDDIDSVAASIILQDWLYSQPRNVANIADVADATADSSPSFDTR
ncbi:MAG: Holliday junction resolvase RuvX [Gammaproteobacteria bacterium WSBS_2016_MAG_OTU1]